MTKAGEPLDEERAKQGPRGTNSDIIAAAAALASTFNFDLQPPTSNPRLSPWSSPCIDTSGRLVHHLPRRFSIFFSSPALA